MRIPIIAGNWKMNNTIKEGLKLIEDIKTHKMNKDVEAVVCVPYTLLKDIKESTMGTNIKLGAQNMHWEESGAFTGEVSPKMLKEIGLDYVLVGHSERRQYFNETDETVNKKVKSALNHDINPILCVGETLEQRESNTAKEVIKNQIIKAFEGVEKNQLSKVVVAYEPIWAIGTGKTASADDANDMIAFIRETLGSLYDEAKNSVRIQYGGSVNPSNVSELMNKIEIDGALVGGASLKAKDFVDLINF